MLYALINSGQVLNVIVADSEFAESLIGQYENIIPCGSKVGPGYTWNEVDGFFEPIVEIIEETIIEEPVTE